MLPLGLKAAGGVMCYPRCPSLMRRVDHWKRLASRVLRHIRLQYQSSLVGAALQYWRWSLKHLRGRAGADVLEVSVPVLRGRAGDIVTSLYQLSLILWTTFGVVEEVVSQCSGDRVAESWRSPKGGAPS